MQLPENKKLTVAFRVEPGCLGPTGDQKVDEFCRYAQKEIISLDADYVIWKITPRNDKSLPEMEYMVNGKRLSHEQAARYLAAFEANLGEFEEHLNDKITQFINDFLGH
jgi:hypothetical protein